MVAATAHNLGRCQLILVLQTNIVAGLLQQYMPSTQLHRKVELQAFMAFPKAQTFHVSRLKR